MRTEYLDLVTPEGVPTGATAPRAVVHATGAWHLSVHVWLVDGDLVLLQKRADDKESYPGLYDAAAAGHVSAGETCPAAALRETREELGIVLEESDLVFLGQHRLCMEDTSSGFVSNEINRIYLARVDAQQCVLHLQEEEVGGAVWMSFDRLDREMARHPQAFCVDPEELALVREHRYGA